jgi:hypothetical protein
MQPLYLIFIDYVYEYEIWYVDRLWIYVQIVYEILFFC